MTILFISAATLTFSTILIRREVRIAERIDTHRRLRGLL